MLNLLKGLLDNVKAKFMNIYSRTNKFISSNIGSMDSLDLLR